MTNFLYKLTVRKIILLQTRYLNLLQDVRVIIIDNKIKTLNFQKNIYITSIVLGIIVYTSSVK